MACCDILYVFIYLCNSIIYLLGLVTTFYLCAHIPFVKNQRKRLFAYMIEQQSAGLENSLKKTKDELFVPLKDLSTHSPELAKKEKLKILEIGPGTGVNLKYYPKGTQLTVVEPNRHFEKYFQANQSQFPDITVDRFISGYAEDMSDVEDDSVDVVVLTMVLCSVRDVHAVIKEVKRILVDGGLFIYLDHVGAEPGTKDRKIQDFITETGIWPFLYDGCHDNRDPAPLIEAAGFSEVTQSKIQVDDPPFYEPFLFSYVTLYILHGFAVK